jgi:Putative phage tail protein
MAGLFIHSTPNNASQQAAALGLSVSTSVYGLTLPIIYGATRVPGNMIWYGAFTATPQYTQTSSGKGGGGSQATQTGYNYTASFMLGLCEGPITSINAIWNNGVLDTTDTFSTFTGGSAQTAWGYLTTLDSIKALTYRNLAYIAAANYNLGSSANLPQLTFEVYGKGYGTSITGIPDVDPAFIITDILTSDRYGAVFPVANLGTWTSYKAYCIANGLLFSPAYDATQTAAKAITDLLALTNSEAYFSEGLLKITPYGDTEITANGYTYTPNSTPIYELGDDAFISDGSTDPVLVERGSQADAYNQIDIECLDRTNSYNKTSIRASDQVNVDVYGVRSMSNVTAHQICNTSIAQSSAQLILQRNLYIRNKYIFTLSIQYILLEPTDYVTLVDSALGLISAPVRILTIDENGDELLITAEDAPAGVGSHAVYGTQSGGGGGVNNLVQPGNTATPNIFVPPSVLTATGLEIWMGAYGATPATWGGCEVWVSYDNASYAYVGAIDSPVRMGTLTATLASGADPDTTNTLAVNILSGQALGSATIAEWDNYASLALVDGEFIAYQTATLTSANHYNLTNLHRGLYGSTIASHANGSNFIRVEISAMFKMPIMPDKIGKTIYVKLPAYNQFGAQLQQLSACSATTFTIAISQVPALTGITIAPVYGGFTIKYPTPTQADFGGVNVYMSTTSGFSPGSGYLVYSGPDSLITITADASGTALVGGTTYYVRIAGYTESSKANMIYSSEYNVVPIAPTKTATASLYQWSSAIPTNPSGSSTFTWATYAVSGYTGAGGWSVTAPANPVTPGVQLWIASKVVSDNGIATTTTVSWTSGYSFVIAGANGTNGTNGTNGAAGASGYQAGSPTVYQWAVTIPAAPSGSPNYTWATGLFGTAPSGWTLTTGTSPSPGYTLWAAKVSITDSATATTTSFNWTSSSIVAVGYAGANGTNGTIGSDGAQGASYVAAYCASATASTTTTPATTSGINSVPATNGGGITGTWNKTVPTLTSDQFMYQVNGIYNPATGNVTWSIPYWSSLKVGSLSAISANLGTVMAGIIQSSNYTGTTGTQINLNDGTATIRNTSGTNSLILSGDRLQVGNLTGKYCELNGGDIVFHNNFLGLDKVTKSLQQVTTGTVPSNSEVTLDGYWTNAPKIMVSAAIMDIFSPTYSNATQKLAVYTTNLRQDPANSGIYKFTAKAELQLGAGSTAGVSVNKTSPDSNTTQVTGSYTTLASNSITVNVGVSCNPTIDYEWEVWVSDNDPDDDQAGHYETRYGSGTAWTDQTIYVNIDGVDHIIVTYNEYGRGSYSIVSTVSGLTQAAHVVYIKMVCTRLHGSNSWTVPGVGSVTATVTFSSINFSGAATTALASGTLNYIAIG